jgi:hypothetical protein
MVPVGATVAVLKYATALGVVVVVGGMTFAAVATAVYASMIGGWSGFLHAVPTLSAIASTACGTDVRMLNLPLACVDGIPNPLPSSVPLLTERRERPGETPGLSCFPARIGT